MLAASDTPVDGHVDAESPDVALPYALIGGAKPAGGAPSPDGYQADRAERPGVWGPVERVLP